ncbi:HNH endonuclease [Pedobacter sp. AW31-3R]|uniref:HNH endonuclease n=1 Tax=Pedobacter sp. AW31-3R TaxID=3445781 RepID=UPI003F9FA828
MQTPLDNAILTDHLLNLYFSDHKDTFFKAKKRGEGYLHEQEISILNEPEARTKHISIHTEEDIFVRNGLFKRLVPKAYLHCCSFTGMKLNSTYGHSFVDACHIIHFNITHNDSITNGIALCPNLHRAFDRGLVSLDDDYQILVSDHIYEDENHPYSLKKLKAKKMYLPVHQNAHPALENLRWHRQHIFKG